MGHDSPGWYWPDRERLW